MNDLLSGSVRKRFDLDIMLAHATPFYLNLQVKDFLARL